MKIIRLTILFIFIQNITFASDGSKITGTGIVQLIVAALIPILASYLFKIFEGINLSSRESKELDINKKKIEFLNEYYYVQKEFITNTEELDLRNVISKQMSDIKESMDDTLTCKTIIPDKLSITQKLFLNFKPGTFWGWIWKISYYSNIIIVIFGIYGSVLDEDLHYSKTATMESISDGSLAIGIFFFLCLSFFFRHLAILDKKHAMEKKIKSQL